MMKQNKEALMKKTVICVVAALLLFHSFTFQCFATTNDTLNPKGRIITCADGGYIVVEISEDPSFLARSENASNTISGSVTYTKKSSSNVVQWVAVLNASFSYDGYSSTCIAANCNVSFYDSSYSLSNKSVTKAGNTAIAVITIAYKILGITISTNTYTLTLSCDSTGHLF